MRGICSAVLAVLTVMTAAPLRAEEEAQAPADTPKPATNTATPTAAAPQAGGAMDSICLILESAAAANALPLEFFARVIWQESRFRPDARGPVTRSGHRAEGIAQFMPYTADERGLLDPFNPVAALAEGGGISARAARGVRQSRTCGRRLQCRAGQGAARARRE